MTPDKLRAIVAKNIKKQRVLKGLTQQQLAELADKEMRYISHLERNKANITLTVLAQIADALGVHPASLCEDGSAKGTGLKPPKKVGPGIDYAISILKGIKAEI